MGVVATPQVIINGQTHFSVPNPSLKNKDGSPKSYLDHVADWTSKSEGAFRFLQLFERASKAAVLVLKEMGSSLAGFFDRCAGICGMAWVALSIPRLPHVTRVAKKAIVEWSKPVANTTARDKIEKIHDIVDAAATYGYAGSLVFNNPVLKNMADIPSLVGDVTDLSMAAEDWSLAKKHVELIDKTSVAHAPVLEKYVDTQRHSLIKMIKATSAVVGGVLGLLALVLGGPLLSPVPMLCIALFTTSTAIMSYFFKETARYELADFHKIRQAVVLAPAPAGAPQV